MRIVVMGTGPFAIPTCKRIVTGGHHVPLVVTRPATDAHARKRSPRPVYQWAMDAGIEVVVPANVNAADSISRIASCAPDLLFVCDYGQILSSECLSMARLGGINLHGSLLPRHRGAAPVQWALLSGDDETGVTVIHMTPRLDAGPALAVATTKIQPDETAVSLEPRLAELGVAATMSAIDLLAGWDGTSTIGDVQDQSLVTKAPRLSKSDGQLDFRLDASYLVRQVRACQPWPGTFAEMALPEGKRFRLIVRAARYTTQEVKALTGASPGMAVAVHASELGLNWLAPWNHLIAVATGNGLFLISRLQIPGKREMDTEDFLRGHPIADTAQFLLPPVTSP